MKTRVFPPSAARKGAGIETRPDLARAFGRLSHDGVYATTVTRPALFRDYLTEQLGLLADDYAIEIEVGPSQQEIPFPYVIDASAGLGGVSPQDLAEVRFAIGLRGYRMEEVDRVLDLRRMTEIGVPSGTHGVVAGG